MNDVIVPLARAALARARLEREVRLVGGVWSMTILEPYRAGTCTPSPHSTPHTTHHTSPTSARYFMNPGWRLSLAANVRVNVSNVTFHVPSSNSRRSASGTPKFMYMWQARRPSISLAAVLKGGVHLSR